MKMHEALSELLIFAREQGGDDQPHVRRVLECIEDLSFRTRQRDYKKRNRDRCIRCEQRLGDGMLCWPCLADAPREVQQAFKQAVGLDGMREATETILKWARRHSFHESEAA